MWLLSFWAVHMPIHLGVDKGHRSGEAAGNKEG